MAYNINRVPLLQEDDSEEYEETPEHFPNDTITRIKPLFKSAEPRDKYYMAYFIFYLLGVVTILPWNFFVTADDVR